MTNNIYSIDDIRNIVAPIAKAYGVERVYLFGSYARGEATGKSDVDFKIDLGKIDDLIELSGLLMELESALSKSVDIVSSDRLSNKFLSNIRKEGVLLYEQ